MFTIAKDQLHVIDFFDAHVGKSSRARISLRTRPAIYTADRICRVDADTPG